MISDEDIKYFASVHAGGAIGEMAIELLAYREAERKAKSWDDTEAWVQTRRKVTEFYDNTGQLRGKFYGEPEKRPK